MVTNSLVYMQHGKPPLIEHTIGLVAPHVTKQTYNYELIYCELAQLVVDSLLHALQDLRYIWSLHRKEQVVVGYGS